MVDVLDFREEARGCLHLAEAETDPEVRTVLMGMVLGWITLAHHSKSPPALQHEPSDDDWDTVRWDEEDAASLSAPA
jgi:hypothetical protein